MNSFISGNRKQLCFGSTDLNALHSNVRATQLPKQAASIGAGHDGVENREPENVLFFPEGREVSAMKMKKSSKKLPDQFYSEVGCSATECDVQADFSLVTKDSYMKEEGRGGRMTKKLTRWKVVRCRQYRGLVATPTK